MTKEKHSETNVLKQIRECNGFSTQEMANILGVSRTSLYAIEKQNPLKNKYFQKIKHLLNNNENLLSEDIKNNNYSVMSSKSRNNNIRRIRKLLHLTPAQLAEKCNCSSQHIYTLERGTQELNELWILKLTKAFQCDKYYLFNDFEDIDFLSRNSTINNIKSIDNQRQESINATDAINIAYYNNIIDLVNNQHATMLQYNVEQLQVFINSAATDHSAIKICKNKNETLLINTSILRATDEPYVFVVKNELEENTTAFIATINIDMLTGKTLMKLENGIETVMPSTCKIVGRVISKIVSV